MKIGFIGAGNMGGAIIGGIVNEKLDAKIIVYDKYKSDFENATPAKSASEVAGEADILFLAIKPAVLYDVIAEIKDYVKPEAVVVSIVAGQSIEKMEKAFAKSVKLIRVMPNTPALVGAGMSALCPNKNVQKSEVENVIKIFEALGRAEIVDEKMMDAVTAVSGSAPAYIFMIIEAMADAAVMGGLPRDKAYTFAAQAVLGSAEMVLKTGKHPGELKDMVCSPSGTTIEAVKVLEERGLRSAIIEAMQACMDKSKNM